MISNSCEFFDINPETTIQSFYDANPGYKECIKIKKIKFALNNKQRKDLLQEAEKVNYKHYLMIKLQMETGLRINEVVNLAVNQLNLCSGEIRIASREAKNELKVFKTKTLSSNRVVPISKSMINLLKPFLAGRKTGYLFLSQKGGPFLKNTAIGFINKYAKKSKSLGFNIGSHSLRRTYASYLIHNKIPIGDLSRILGHASIRTTLKYLFDITDIDFDAVRRVTEKMNK